MGQQFLDVVEIPAFFIEAHGMRPRLVGTLFRRLFHLRETRSKGLVDHRSEWGMQLGGKGARAFQNVIIDGQCRSHEGMLTSRQLMSTHQSRPSHGEFFLAEHARLNDRRTPRARGDPGVQGPRARDPLSRRPHRRAGPTPSRATASPTSSDSRKARPTRSALSSAGAAGRTWTPSSRPRSSQRSRCTTSS